MGQCPRRKVFFPEEKGLQGSAASCGWSAAKEASPSTSRHTRMVEEKKLVGLVPWLARLRHPFLGDFVP